VTDYATNEPTVIANALGLALNAWYAPTITPEAYLPLVLKKSG
jgi:hypothetical protein